MSKPFEAAVGAAHASMTQPPNAGAREAARLLRRELELCGIDMHRNISDSRVPDILMAALDAFGAREREQCAAIAAGRLKLRDCNICGGQVDLSNAKKPPMNFEMPGRTKRKAQIEGQEHQPSPLSRNDIAEIERISTRQMVPQMVPISAAERAKPAASGYEAARPVISEWLNHDLTSWLDTELAELRELIAAALAERGERERERCAKVAENPGFIQAQDTEWDEGVNYAKRYIAAAIRNQALTED